MHTMAISIPYFRSSDGINRAVTSILNQTWKDLAAVVVNDADGDDPPWSALHDVLNEQRLWRVTLTENKGPYFIHALVLNAFEPEFFAVQASDDWSEPERLAVLASHLGSTNDGVVISAVRRWEDNHASTLRYQRFLAPSSRMHIPEVGLFRASELHRIGGYFGGFRLGFDSMLMSALRLSSSLGYIDAPLYNYVSRANSLTNSSTTGFGSKLRSNIRAQLDCMQESMHKARAALDSGTMARETFEEHIRATMQTYLTPSAAEELASATGQLRDAISQDDRRDITIELPSSRSSR